MSLIDQLSGAQLSTLESMHEVLAPHRWVLIGATAIQCRVDLPRPTADVDFAVAAPIESVADRLVAAGWQRHPKRPHRWKCENATIDVIAATQKDILNGEIELGEGFVMSVVGFDLAYSEVDPLPITDDVTIAVPRVWALLLLKIVSWLDRPRDRSRDLEDIARILDWALPDDDDRRWNNEHPVSHVNLEFDQQSAFFVGWELGRVADVAHLHLTKRFIDIMRNEDSAHFALFVRCARPSGSDPESTLRDKLRAFETGVEWGVHEAHGAAARPTSTATGKPMARPEVFSWGRTDSAQRVLHDAIDRRRIVRFFYDGMERIVEPHILGTKDGRLQILTWQIGGQSSSGPLPDWRRFFVDELSNLQPTGEAFSGRSRTSGRRSAFDRYIAIVRRSS